MRKSLIFFLLLTFAPIIKGEANTSIKHISINPWDIKLLTSEGLVLSKYYHFSPIFNKKYKKIEFSNGISVGDDYRCGVDYNDKLECSSDDHYAPDSFFKVPGNLGEIAQITVGNGLACVVNTTGDLNCWGRSQEKMPKIKEKVIKVKAYDKTVCALYKSHKLRCWGRERELGASINEREPKIPSEKVVNFDFYENVDSHYVYSGICVIKDNGDLYCKRGKELPMLSGSNAKLVGISEDQTCYTHNQGVECGLTESFYNPENYRPPSHLKDIVKLFMDRKNVCGLRENGQAVCWGKRL